VRCARSCPPSTISSAATTGRTGGGRTLRRVRPTSTSCGPWLGTASARAKSANDPPPLRLPFNFGFQPKLDKDLVMELATLRFVAQGKSVLLAGMTDVATF
jgi:hypothetical protein